MVVSSCRPFGITLDAMTCLSRRDPNKDIFKKVKKQQKNKRHNFYNLMPDDGMLVCQNESYPLKEVCLFRDRWQRKNCTLKNANAVNLNHLRP